MQLGTISADEIAKYSEQAVRGCTLKCTLCKLRKTLAHGPFFRTFGMGLAPRRKETEGDFRESLGLGIESFETQRSQRTQRRFRSFAIVSPRSRRPPRFHVSCPASSGVAAMDQLAPRDLAFPRTAPQATRKQQSLAPEVLHRRRGRTQPLVSSEQGSHRLVVVDDNRFEGK